MLYKWLICQLFNTPQPLIQFIERLVLPAPSVGELFILPELQQEAFGQFFNGLLQGREELLIGKIACGGAFLEAVCYQGFRHLIQGIHFDVHQLMDDDFFKVFLGRIHCIDQQDRFSVIAVDLEVAGFRPGGILYEFQPDVPGGGDPEFSDIFLK